VKATVRILAFVLATGLAIPLAHARKAAPSAAAKAHFKQGRAYQEAGAYADAIKEYEQAYALAPLPDLLYNIGQCHRLGGDKLKAIAAYQRYLAAAPEDGALAEEARNHVAALKLKLQVEEAEAAKRRALEEAEAAKRRAKELEEGRVQAAAEAYRRVQREQAERERQAKAAAEAARQRELEAKVRQAAADREYRKRVKEAGKRGGLALRITGGVATGLAALMLVPGIIATVEYFERESRLRDWDKSGTRWSAEQDKRLHGLNTCRHLMFAFYSVTGVLLATGIVTGELGAWQRRRAKRAVRRPVTVLPQIGPDGGGLLVQGRF
jgi:tetratricopeptide (TPR) repeat protein